MDDDRDCPLKTKRLVVGQVTICHGCCCGNVERGLPGVPVEWLKSEQQPDIFVEEMRSAFRKLREQ